MPAPYLRGCGLSGHINLRILGVRLRGRTTTKASKKGSGRVLEKGSQKGS